MMVTLPGRSLACALLLGLTLASCAHAPAPSVVALPNGYYIERDRSSQLRIVTRGGRQIIAPLAGYAVYGNVVTGLVGPETRSFGAYPNESPLPESKEPLYFVLDTTTGQLEKELSASAWKTKLQELQATTSPSLRAPLLPG